MSTIQNGENSNYDRELNKDENSSASQNNNGNIGREVENEKEGSGSFKKISGNPDEKPVNENGVGENQENHWVGNHGQRSSNRPGSQGVDGFSDQNLTDGVQQNKGRNHVTNAGGTSQEDLEKGKTGLTDEENNS